MKKSNNAFTLIELLAIIVILAIVALIATPIILNTINDAKKSSAELSVKNYIRAVELAIAKEYINDSTINLNATCEVDKNKKQIKCGDKDIKVDFDGEGLITGTLILESGEVIRLIDGKINGINTNVEFFNGEITFPVEIKKSTLIRGPNFNTKIKTLANNTNMVYSIVDTTIMSIEFYSRGLIPKGYTKETLNKLKENNQFVDVSLNEDGSIIAYYDNGKILVCSDNLISFNEYSSNMFSDFSNLLNIEFGNIDTSQSKYMNHMFYGCGLLIKLDVSKFDTSQVTTMQSMFCGCRSLKELDVSKFNTSNVKTMHTMFENCLELEILDVSNFDTKNVESMQKMFYYCKKLKELDVSNFNTNNVKDKGMYSMFAGCSGLTSLDVSNFNTSKVTHMGVMFSGCSGLTSLDVSNFDTSKVTDMSYMFESCMKLEMLDLRNFDTRNVTNMTKMFLYASKLKPILIGENFKIPENATNMFTSCATQNAEQLCVPGSTEEWCIINN